jgi:hypothetical protein
MTQIFQRRQRNGLEIMGGIFKMNLENYFKFDSNEVSTLFNKSISLEEYPIYVSVINMDAFDFEFEYFSKELIEYGLNRLLEVINEFGEIYEDKDNHFVGLSILDIDSPPITPCLMISMDPKNELQDLIFEEINESKNKCEQLFLDALNFQREFQLTKATSSSDPEYERYIYRQKM